MNSGLLAQILKFVAVGGVGFLIDGGLLFAMVWDGADPLLA